MAVYTVLLIWVMVCNVLQKANIRIANNVYINGKTLYLFFAFFAIWAVMTFRDISIGTDTYAYTQYFAYIATSNSLVDAVEIDFISGNIFKGLAYIFGKISYSPQFYIFWTSSIIIFGVSIYIYRTSKWVMVSTFLFLTLNLFFISMNTGRQWMAIGLALNALISLYYDSKSKLGWGLFVIAFGIHNAIVSFFPTFLGMFIVKRFGLTKKICIETIAITIIGITLFSGFIVLFSSYFPHYAMYINSNTEDNFLEDTGGGKIIIEYLAFLIILLMYFIIRKFDITQLKNNILIDAMIPGAIFCVIVGIIFFKNNLVNRILLPYQCLFLSIIPYVFSRFDAKSRFLLYLILFIGMFGSYYLWINSNLGNILPYRTSF